MMRLADHHTYTGPVEPKGKGVNCFLRTLTEFWQDYGRDWVEFLENLERIMKKFWQDFEGLGRVLQLDGI